MFPLFKEPYPSKRPRITLGLTVQIPKKIELKDILKSIENNEEQINIDFIALSHQDIRRIAHAFEAVPNNSPMKIRVREVFTNPRLEGNEKLILFWDAIKYKVQEILWDGNKFYKSFLKHLTQDIEKNPTITARNQFLRCDQTASPYHKPAGEEPSLSI
jgi:hypothetical protein